MELGLKGRIAVIVGGARGIGYATAERLTAEGAAVVLADIDADGVRHAAKRLGEASAARVMALPLDITNAEAVAAMPDAIAAELGPPDILVNTAAILENKTFLESAPEDWERMLGVCLTGPMLVLHTLLPGMCERGFGRAVFFASDAARVGQARLSYYAAAKGGIIALLKSVAQEVGRHGVTLNVLSPGATDTELRQARETKLEASMGPEKYERYTQAVVKRYPMGRIGKPADIAGMTAFLCGDQAAWITGQVISVNGGFVMP